MAGRKRCRRCIRSRSTSSGSATARSRTWIRARPSRYELSKIEAVVRNIRNVKSDPDDFPSPLTLQAAVFDSGRLSIDGRGRFPARALRRGQGQGRAGRHPARLRQARRRPLRPGADGGRIQWQRLPRGHAQRDHRRPRGDARGRAQGRLRLPATGGGAGEGGGQEDGGGRRGEEQRAGCRPPRSAGHREGRRGGLRQRERPAHVSRLAHAHRPHHRKLQQPEIRRSGQSSIDRSFHGQRAAAGAGGLPARDQGPGLRRGRRASKTSTCEP